MITGLAHINLLVPQGTLDQAYTFYGETLGLYAAPVPERQKGTIAWFNLTDDPKPQQIHVAFGTNESDSPRHPCFRIESMESLQALRQRLWEHHLKGDAAAPMHVDKPGEKISGPSGFEYPNRFFARDFAGNLLEFSV
ncbi:putative glyoxalase family protein [Aspergillus ruber CBS 135680]|uniref:VOC domain-containing protein n=1 Tax=Aspergillus ruber (strain CBS 135680) TaxID=1388766 RepID=A0A017SIR5_ASPRC|nr:uncharacterized protein EURHEDRAFT_514602 [Aspergillus ruber CBS 135680]EYE96195.1 hypothetical protein EURHEDRAFT_514602 [Aspergillus ruber CBS 135680]